MKTILATIACMTISATASLADTQFFGAIISDSAKIEREAMAVRDLLKTKKFNVDEVRKTSEVLGGSIATLKKDVEQFEPAHPGMTEAQKKDWELVKTKAQLLAIFHDRKAELLSAQDVDKQRSLIRAHAKGIAERAALLRETAIRLSR